MRAVASFSAAALVAALSACAPVSGLPDVSLFGGGNDTQAEATTAANPAETAGADVAGAPPLPARDVRKRRTKPVSQLAAGRRPQDEKPQEEKQASLALPSLPDVKLFAASADAPDSVNWDGAPVAVYTQLAQQIRACWLAPATTKLPNHGFHADVSPNDANNARIIIYEKDPQGKRGVQAFRINISAGGGGSTVQSENRRLDKTLDGAFKADLARWSKGDQSCKG